MEDTNITATDQNHISSSRNLNLESLEDPIAIILNDK